MNPSKPSLLINRSAKLLDALPELTVDDDAKQLQTQMYRAGMFCLMQGSASVSLILLNKYLATYFNYPILTLMGQNAGGLILSILCWYLGVGPTMQAWKFAHFVKVVPMAVLFTTLLYTSFRTMGYISIATVVVFRNAGPLFTAVGEYCLRDERFSQNSMVALGMMVVGGLTYSYNDLHYDGVGYLWAGFNLLCNTAAGLFGKGLSMDLKTEQTGLGLACYQNIVSMPMFLAVAVITGEAERWSVLLHPTTPTPTPVVIAGLASCVACTAMGVSTFELQRLVSQATVAVANCSYKLVTLLAGIVLFGNNIGMMGFVGLCIAQASAILYIYERQFSSKKTDSEATKSRDLESGASMKEESPKIAETRSPLTGESKEKV